MRYNLDLYVFTIWLYFCKISVTIIPLGTDISTDTLTLVINNEIHFKSSNKIKYASFYFKKITERNTSHTELTH